MKKYANASVQHPHSCVSHNLLRSQVKWHWHCDSARCSRVLLSRPIGWMLRVRHIEIYAQIIICNQYHRRIWQFFIVYPSNLKSVLKLCQIMVIKEARKSSKNRFVIFTIMCTNNLYHSTGNRNEICVVAMPEYINVALIFVWWKRIGWFYCVESKWK